MTTRRHQTLFVAILLAAGLSGACATLGGTTSIAEVQSNPGHYVDRTVNVTGVVTSSWGIPFVPYRMYRVSDGGAEITVLSDGRRTPSRGSRVRVRGEVEEFAVLGGRSVGLHLRERSLKVL